METQISQSSSSTANPSKRAPEHHKSMALSKSNQVGTVMLYGIPIVSLFIESQERLCLAQISNTLLKQFSYNEIHNRRVALGITCVQCTPVQLEILRRAGAMPVSSRRCGMITRREAERLCKSFLGDNAPPRLPDDFAFSVIHECAWGCRGSFMPSRYNSSRAKCIKCFYCGLFFSPNKFIFHSHRIGPSDKYVQPDAANFNSWRRHLKLFGGPPQDISYAWEDVKAMFNGGTRKRVSSDGSSEGRATPQSSHHHHPSRNSGGGGSGGSIPLSPKRIKLSSSSPVGSVAHSHGSSTPHSMQSLSPPYSKQQSMHVPHSSSATTVSNSGSIPGTGRLGLTSADLPIPFSRSFMMDYMWHHQQQQQSNHVPHGLIKPPTSNLPSAHPPPAIPAGVVSTPPFPIPPYAIPWLKRPSALFFPPVGLTGNGVPSDLPASSSGNSFIDSKAFSFYNNSAFKPVVTNGQVVGMNRSHQQPEVMSVKASQIVKEPVSSDEEEEGGSNRNSPVYHSKRNHRMMMLCGTKGQSGSVEREREEEEVEDEDDEILVDIETTEDDDVQLRAVEVKQDVRMLSPKVFPSSGHSTPTIQNPDPNNNTREDPMKRSSRATPNHMPTISSSAMSLANATPLKEDSTHSNKSSSYSPLSQSPAPEFSSPTMSGGVNAPILSPGPSSMSTSCTGHTNNNNNSELWSVARLTALERNVGVAAAEQNIHSHHQPHQSHLNGGSGYYNQGENLIVQKVSSGGSSASSPVSVSPPIYGHPHHQIAIHGSGSGVSIQKPIAATFYRHELAKQFHLYRSHHGHLQQTEGGNPASTQSNGVV